MGAERKRDGHILGKNREGARIGVFAVSEKSSLTRPGSRPVACARKRDRSRRSEEKQGCSGEARLGKEGGIT